ncbi:ECF RNA polymerase sigma factor SigX [Polaribacter huanghezhanensis]|uniref:RNA polymerase sigma factor n=1 Tax=Polaribacter huanghezhanensis TaxID=1354726 RepID=UPI0026476461|nr:sigma-70 family RNA polymerase sigma factor [Polaribacter huanghezhanensis]WKD86558.1 ECF RNA polymerase sigma factor SigX [Polaribacter huanghezhanensis]
MNKLSDQYIWKTLKEGDLKAFAILYKTYYPKLYNYGLKISKRVPLTEDTLHDFFLYIYEHRQNLSDLDAIAPYLFASYRRHLITALKKKSKIVSFDKMNINIIDIQFTSEEIMIQQESKTFRNKNINTLLNKLPKRQKEAIYLKYYCGLNTNDISEIMNLNYQSTSNTIHKAIKNLREETSILQLINS